MLGIGDRSGEDPGGQLAISTAPNEIKSCLLSEINVSRVPRLGAAWECCSVK